MQRFHQQKDIQQVQKWGTHHAFTIWIVLSRNNFTKLSTTLVRKLTNKKIPRIIRQLEIGTHPGEIASVMKVTRRRIYQLKHQYKDEGLYPESKDPGRKKRPVSAEFERVILYVHQIYKSRPVILEKIIKTHYGIAIPHNTIYRLMLMQQLVVENPRKKCQRKRVRFERKHSMSLWQGDWKEFEFEGSKKLIIAFIDDSSSFITCYGIFDSPTTGNTIAVLSRGFREYGTPREILTAQGTRFVLTWDRDFSQHTFKEFLNQHNVTHIIARLKHPQTNGKIERWFGFFNRNSICSLLSTILSSGTILSNLI